MGLVSPGSVIDNQAYNYIHSASDYNAKTGAGCGPCGTGAAANSGFKANLERKFRSRDQVQESSFGVNGWYWNWDINLTLYDVDGETRVDLFDAKTISGQKRFYETGDHFLDTRLIVNEIQMVHFFTLQSFVSEI